MSGRQLGRTWISRRWDAASAGLTAWRTASLSRSGGYCPRLSSATFPASVTAIVCARDGCFSARAPLQHTAEQLSELQV